jgi:hypothetical protein
VSGTWRGGSFTGYLEGYVEEGSGDGDLFPLGSLEGGSFIGEFERWMKDLEMAISLHRGPTEELGGGAHLPGTLRGG